MKHYQITIRVNLERQIKLSRDHPGEIKIWSRRSTLLPEFVNSSVRIYNGKTFVRTKISEGKVGLKFGECLACLQSNLQGRSVGVRKTWCINSFDIELF
ncbi:hypothetical protein POPTR_019G101950v4 [Populus trichocarpa]|uniref:Uncharacterized protein n=1 Tax=Populus trichocarpa TaxID=3694 RepID=A0ACC0RKW9_POPTR|nr:hypothetical protein POPTR_019G101950v4 [Populus trichocarpa]